MSILITLDEKGGGVTPSWGNPHPPHSNIGDISGNLKSI